MLPHVCIHRYSLLVQTVQAPLLVQLHQGHLWYPTIQYCVKKVRDGIFGYDALTRSVTYVFPRLSCVPWWSPGSWQAIVSLLSVEKVNNMSNKKASTGKVCTLFIWTYSVHTHTYYWDSTIFLPLVHRFLIHLEVLSYLLTPFHPETYNKISPEVPSDTLMYLNDACKKLISNSYLFPFTSVRPLSTFWPIVSSSPLEQKNI